MSHEVLQQVLQYGESNSFGGSDTLELIVALREVLAHPEQKPCKGENCGSTNPKLHSAECFDEHEFTVLNIKPFGYFEFVLDDGDGYWREIEDGGIDGKPLYTSPPQRQPLTEDQLFANDDLMALNATHAMQMSDIVKIVRVIEAAQNIGDKT